MIDYDKESAFQAGTRIMIERQVEEAHQAGDAHQVDANLLIHPYGRERQGVSLEVAHYIARQAMAEDAA